MSYEEHLARIMLVLSAPTEYGSYDATMWRIATRAHIKGPITGKLVALRRRGWVSYKEGYSYGGGYWRLTPAGAVVREMLRIVRDRTVESPAWP